MPPFASPPRYALIDALRALACLAVVLFHTEEGGHIPLFLAAMPAWIQAIFTHGHAGVSVFFVISGFVIAHSMAADEVDGRYVGRFMLRRSLRLDPPYWAAIALALGSAWLAARMVPGKSFEWPSAENLLLHVMYLMDFFGAPKINTAFWTLCLEIQFYLSFVLLMWLATAWGRRIGRGDLREWLLYGAALVAALWASPWAPFNVPGLFLAHWDLFMAGVLVRRALTMTSRRGVICCAAYLALLTALHGAWRPDVSVFVGLAAALAMLIGGLQGWLQTFSGGRLLRWLGLISYSLYLTHSPLTGAGFRLGYLITGRSAATEALWLALVVAGCCVFAWGFFLVFERLGLHWSKQIALHRPQAPLAERPALARAEA